MKSSTKRSLSLVAVALLLIVGFIYGSTIYRERSLGKLQAEIANLLSANKYDEAQAKAESALKKAEQFFAKTDLRLAIALDQLAAVELGQSKTEAAILHLNDSLAIKKSQTKPNDIELASTIARLGLAKAKQNDPEAQALLTQAWEVLKAQPLAQPALAAETAAALGEMQRVAGNMTEAMPLLEQALELSKTAAPKNTAGLAKAQLSLGLLQINQANQLPAEDTNRTPLIERAQANIQGALTAIDPEGTSTDASVGQALVVLAQASLASGNAAEAETHLVRAVAIAQAAGAESVEAITAARELGKAQYAQEKWADVETTLTPVVEAESKNSGGAAFPAMAESTYRLAMAKMQLSKALEAEPLLESSIDGFGSETQYSKDKLNAQRILGQMRAQSNPGSAEELLTQYVTTAKAESPTVSAPLVSAMESLATAQAAQGKKKDAAQTLKDALTAAEADAALSAELGPQIQSMKQQLASLTTAKTAKAKVAVKGKSTRQVAQSSGGKAPSGKKASRSSASASKFDQSIAHYRARVYGGKSQAQLAGKVARTKSTSKAKKNSTTAKKSFKKGKGSTPTAFTKSVQQYKTRVYQENKTATQQAGRVSDAEQSNNEN